MVLSTSDFLAGVNELIEILDSKKIVLEGLDDIRKKYTDFLESAHDRLKSSYGVSETSTEALTAKFSSLGLIEGKQKAKFTYTFLETINHRLAKELIDLKQKQTLISNIDKLIKEGYNPKHSYKVGPEGLTFESTPAFSSFPRKLRHTIQPYKGFKLFTVSLPFFRLLPLLDISKASELVEKYNSTQLPNRNTFLLDYFDLRESLKDSPHRFDFFNFPDSLTENPDIDVVSPNLVFSLILNGTSGRSINEMFKVTTGEEIVRTFWEHPDIVALKNWLESKYPFDEQKRRFTFPSPIYAKTIEIPVSPNEKDVSLRLFNSFTKTMSYEYYLNVLIAISNIIKEDKGFPYFMHGCGCVFQIPQDVEDASIADKLSNKLNILKDNLCPFVYSFS